MSERVDVSTVKKIADLIMAELGKIVVGKKDVIRNMLVALLAGGHVLLEGVPGVAKTFIAKYFAATMGLDFKRIQFTADLLPADIIGTNIYSQKTNEFEFIKGPIFTNILLADEINRAPPKTQGALLEAMQEKQVTVEGVTYKLQEPFMVLATQNPIETEGVYPLPEAQLDRFLFKLDVDYPTLDEELEIIKKKLTVKDPDEAHVDQIADRQTILRLRDIVLSVFVDEDVLKYISEIIFAFRNNPYVLYGSSPRASIALLFASRALAAIRGRDYVEPDDVRELVYPVLVHRLILKPEAELEGITPKNIIENVLREISVHATIPE